MFSGQAAVAVLISLLELFSAIASIEVEGEKGSIGHTSSDMVRTLAGEQKSRASVDRSATMFFFVMMIGMIVALGAHVYLTRTSLYKEAASRFERRSIRPGSRQISEETPLLTDSINPVPAMEPHTDPIHPSNKSPETSILYVGRSISHKGLSNVAKIVKINWMYNLAVFMVFFVTLVRPPN